LIDLFGCSISEIFVARQAHSCNFAMILPVFVFDRAVILHWFAVRMGLKT